MTTTKQIDFKYEKRQKSFTAVRLFIDQIESLEWLIAHKHRNNRSKADLIREAVDQYVEREKAA